MNVLFLFSLIAITTCNPNPCIHGTCTEIVVGAVTVPYCTCDNRWTGKLCDLDMDGIYWDFCFFSWIYPWDLLFDCFFLATCSADYCQSGGVCRMNGNLAYCECPAMYTGVRCELFVGGITTTTTAATGR